MIKGKQIHVIGSEIVVPVKEMQKLSQFRYLSYLTQLFTYRDDLSWGEAQYWWEYIKICSSSENSGFSFVNYCTIKGDITELIKKVIILNSAAIMILQIY